MGGLAFPQLDAAIGTAEGYGKPGAIPTLAQNPGDLVAGPFATAHGATGAITAANGQQIATFPDFTTGQAAEDALVANNYTGGSISDLAANWLAGSPAADQQNWANTVASQLGVPASTPVTSLAGGGSPQASGVAAPSSSPGWAQSAINFITGNSGTVSGTGFTWSRVAAFMLGLIVLAGAIFLFKPAQQAVGRVVGAVR
jgi:hypothetical protein